jgi:glycosyltransferase involved in cell wall biosynthesis
MKIAYIATGAAGMYCGTCLHDNALAAALQRLGHDAALIPTYTPLRTDEEGVGLDRIFLGAVNVYLQQLAPVLWRLPRGLARLLDRPGLLRFAARLGTSTDPSSLGPLTLSMVRGDQGNQSHELEKLVAWLRDDFKPEVVHLNNTLLVGFVRPLQRALGVPVLCSVQGEDLFLSGLAEPWRGKVLAELRERAGEIDGLVANSAFYADFMADFLGVGRERFEVVPLGLSLTGHGEGPEKGEGGPLTVGYLARLGPEKGLGLALEGFRELARRFPAGAVRFRAAGYLAERDRGFVEEQRRLAAEWGLAEVVEIGGEVDRVAKIAFLQSLDVFTMPALYREPKGLPVLEALANGVPVVVPAHGAFPELVAGTGGGVLVDPGSADALADGLAALLADPDRRRALGRRGREAVHARYSDRRVAEDLLAVYSRVLAERPAA